MLDCLIIGAGPAGLTAAIYLARFHLAVRLVDAGHSRAALIPRTRNHAGYPGGISGRDLLQRMRDQAAEFGAHVEPAVVEKLERGEGHFTAGAGAQSWQARTVLLATGVVNNRPPIAPELHDLALARGLLRYCPICDGYEITDQRVAVIGSGSHGTREVEFLRMYSGSIAFIAPDGPHELSPAERATLRALDVTVIDGPCDPLRIDGDEICVNTPAGLGRYDTVYPALGSVIRSELALSLGAGSAGDGCLVVDAHQRTSIPGLYAAGDVARGLDQISHAMGEAGVAATTIRNDLARHKPLRRQKLPEP